MDLQSAAQAVAEMQMPLAIAVVEDLVEEDLAYAGRLVDAMAPDDGADLLQAMDGSYREEVLAAMPLDTAAALRQLVGYDRESAGGLMTTEYLALRREMSVSEATEVSRTQSISEGIHHLVVIGDDGRLVASRPACGRAHA